MIVRLIIIIFSVLLFQLAAPLPPVDYFDFCKNKFASLLLSMLKPMCCLQCCCHCCKAADWLCIYKTISFLCSVVSACCCRRCWSIVASFYKANFGGWYCHCPSLLRCFQCYCCRQQVIYCSIYEKFPFFVLLLLFAVTTPVVAACWLLLPSFHWKNVAVIAVTTDACCNALNAAVAVDWLCVASAKKIFIILFFLRAVLSLPVDCYFLLQRIFLLSWPCLLLWLLH